MMGGWGACAVLGQSNDQLTFEEYVPLRRPGALQPTIGINAAHVTIG
jgi:hypothetical protein